MVKSLVCKTTNTMENKMKLTSLFRKTEAKTKRPHYPEHFDDFIMTAEDARNAYRKSVEELAQEKLIEAFNQIKNEASKFRGDNKIKLEGSFWERQSELSYKTDAQQLVYYVLKKNGYTVKGVQTFSGSRISTTEVSWL